ncbi:MAG: hypothetical protein JXA57_05885 [Armatimonadetes bacterium]|nr:hypothetical protein [Armatimonadota bacterium]
MSPAEVAKILGALAVAYPSFQVGELRHRLWSEMLVDLDYRLADTAVRRHIATSRFAPSIAEIREQALQAITPDQLTAAEAWGELMEAVRRHYVTHPEEALTELSPATRRVAEMIGWRQIYLCQELDVLRGQFLRMYEQVQGRITREAMLPPTLKEISRSLLREVGSALCDSAPFHMDHS